LFLSPMKTYPSSQIMNSVQSSALIFCFFISSRAEFNALPVADTLLIFND
jgi:hypothetical protein